MWFRLTKGIHPKDAILGWSARWLCIPGLPEADRECASRRTRRKDLKQPLDSPFHIEVLVRLAQVAHNRLKLRVSLLFECEHLKPFTGGGRFPCRDSGREAKSSEQCETERKRSADDNGFEFHDECVRAGGERRRSESGPGWTGISPGRGSPPAVALRERPAQFLAGGCARISSARWRCRALGRSASTKASVMSTVSHPRWAASAASSHFETSTAMSWAFRTAATSARASTRPGSASGLAWPPRMGPWPTGRTWW